MSDLYFIEQESVRWDSDSGFHYDKCKHRDSRACLRCRVRWLVRLWRHGNHVWKLP